MIRLFQLSFYNEKIITEELDEGESDRNKNTCGAQTDTHRPARCGMTTKRHKTASEMQNDHKQTQSDSAEMQKGRGPLMCVRQGPCWELMSYSLFFGLFLNVSKPTLA